jgi:hypothetical protein
LLGKFVFHFSSVKQKKGVAYIARFSGRGSFFAQREEARKEEEGRGGGEERREEWETDDPLLHQM